ncbi:hypothetical protein AMAG_07528 [Allomyces macrogynus ATCC 38327]|uniref:Uncharacterized protein n=1 Tax=Allomyces macrogynus (strain ATCC 38327) TaxID=578462 RepID=A0A0L0SIF0_ALLM3|nr:hypothetical protein AMAG_07528 [Allomyces macrogynus ATCC 38327]|eukprot:KNE62296.1 hypothetical protein AMAG_07528 [Allomyces macrogynus ATCC 38327]
MPSARISRGGRARRPSLDPPPPTRAAHLAQSTRHPTSPHSTSPGPASPAAPRVSIAAHPIAASVDALGPASAPADRSSALFLAAARAPSSTGGDRVHPIAQSVDGIAPTAIATATNAAGVPVDGELGTNDTLTEPATPSGAPQATPTKQLDPNSIKMDTIDSRRRSIPATADNSMRKLTLPANHRPTLDKSTSPLTKGTSAFSMTINSETGPMSPHATVPGPTLLHRPGSTATLMGSDGTQAHQEEQGAVDHFIAYVQKQAATPFSPKRFGRISRLHFTFLSMQCTLWIVNFIQVILFTYWQVQNVKRNGLFARSATTAQLVADVILCFFGFAYVKEVVRFGMWLHLLVSKTAGNGAKWRYAFVAHSGWLMPLLATSQKHVGWIVESKALSKVVHPRVIFWDLVTVDLPNASKNLLYLITGDATGLTLLSAIWVMLSVSFKASRFLWHSILAFNFAQQVQRAHRRRQNDLLVWSRAVQRSVVILGDTPTQLTSTVHSVVLAAAASAGAQIGGAGAPEAASRLMAEFKPAISTVMEVATIAGFQALWRLVRPARPWSSRELRAVMNPAAAAASVGTVGRESGGLAAPHDGSKSGSFLARWRPGDRLKSGILPGNVMGSGALAVPGTSSGALAVPGMGSAGVLATAVMAHGGASTEAAHDEGEEGGAVRAAAALDETAVASTLSSSPPAAAAPAKTPPTSSAWSVAGLSFTTAAAGSAGALGGMAANDPRTLELARLLYAHGKALKYLDRTPTTKVVVTQETLAAMKAVWASEVMQALVKEMAEHPAAWHDRVMATWTKDLSSVPEPGVMASMVPLKLPLVQFCLDRMQRYLDRDRLKPSEWAHVPHSLSELILTELFPVSITRVMPGKHDVLAFVAIDEVPAQHAKVLDVANFVVVMLDLANVDVVVPASKGATTQLAQTVRHYGKLLSNEVKAKRVVVVGYNYERFKAKIQEHPIAHLRTFYKGLPQYVPAANGASKDPMVRILTYFEKWMNVALDKHPDSAALFTDERGWDKCVLALIAEMERRHTLELLDAAKLV